MECRSQRLGAAVGALFLLIGCSSGPDVAERRTGVSSGKSADASADRFAEIVGNACERRATADASLYGEQSLKVTANGYGASTGLYVRPGDQVSIRAEGLWTIWQDQVAPFGAKGHPELSMLNGCRKGSLVAKIGLGADAPTLCIGEEKTFQASTSGMVYLMMNDDASPTYHTGELSVTVASQALPAPTVSYEEAESFAYCEVPSGWVEIESNRHFLLTVPAELAALYRDQLTQTLDFFDQSFQAMQSLNGGGVPFDGHRIRFYPDFTLPDGVWTKTGNPILIDPRHLNAIHPSRSALLGTGNADYSSFDFLRAMGVSFSRYRGSVYQVDAYGAEAFGSLFAMRAMEVMERQDLPYNPCAGKETHEQAGSFSTFLSSPSMQLCLLTTLNEQLGWNGYQSFFSHLPSREDWGSYLSEDATAEAKWEFVARGLMGGLEPSDDVVVTTSAAPSPVPPIFDAFHVPVP